MHNDAILSATRRRNVVATAIGCAVVLAAGLLWAPERVWSNLFVGAFGLLSVGLGGTVFIALTRIAGAGWHVAFRRVPEAMAKMVPIAGIAVIAILLIRIKQYGWHHHGEHGAGTFWFKQLWLTPSFWLLRSVAYVGIWSLLGAWLVHRSRQEDASPAVNSSLVASVRLSALFLAVYAVTFSLAGVDWIMALEPMWFSTMWGVYNFAGMFLSALATVVILCLVLAAPGRALHGVFRDEHLHDLGKLLIGFSCFWMYIWFSQYMLIWYSNIPEETSYFVTRTHGPWGPIVIGMIVLNWIVPFFALLPRPSKRSRGMMMKVAVTLLIGRWVELCVMVFPATLGNTPRVGIWEVAALGATVSLGMLLVDRCFGATRATAPSHPLLSESLHYHAT